MNRKLEAAFPKSLAIRFTEVCQSDFRGLFFKFPIVGFSHMGTSVFGLSLSRIIQHR